MIAAIVGFPPTMRDVAVRVDFTLRDGASCGGAFAGHVFSSTQEEGQGVSERLLCRRFQAVRVRHRAGVRRRPVNLVVRRWSFLGIPLPRALAPIGTAYETVADDRFRFFVEIKLRLVGLLVRYQGWLVTEPEPAPGRRIDVPDGALP